MSDSLKQLREFEDMVRGFNRVNRKDAALDTVAILTAVWSNLPVLWVLFLPCFC